MVARVEQEIHASVKGFVEKIRIKLGDNPRLIVEREKPFFFRIRSVGDPRAPGKHDLLCLSVLAILVSTSPANDAALALYDACFLN